MAPRRRMTERPAAGTSRPWSDLPPDLLRLIAANLASFSDYLRFRGVCSSWRSGAPLRVPFLLLPLPFHRRDGAAFTAANGVVTATAFIYSRDPFLPRVITLRVPESRVHSVCGSSHGSLILITNEPAVVLVSLWNPVTVSNIRLPPLRGLRSPFITKALLSSNPSTPLPRRALVAVWASNKLAFVRVGDLAWSPPIDVGINSLVGEFAYHGGKFFFINDYQPSVKVIDAESQEAFTLNLPLSDQSCSYAFHMVESSEDLFLIARNKEHQDFVFFKLDGSGEMNWFRVEEDDIGDIAFFLSDKQSVVVSSPGAIGCKAKCIYFAGPEYMEHDRFDFARVPSVHLMETTHGSVTKQHLNYWQAPYEQWTEWRNVTGITWFIPSSH